VTGNGSGWVLGLDIGGSGSRIAVAPANSDTGDPARILQGDRVAITGTGSSVPDVAATLIRRVLSAWPEVAGSIAGIGVGATGLATLVASPADMRPELDRLSNGAPLALAVDAVTAHLGALGGHAGAVVVVGTGAFALGTDLATAWHRVDGWGHLLGDRGAGAWIGIRALGAAMLTHDGSDQAATALLAAAVRRFGVPESWPSQLYTQQDRAGVLASFVTDVAELAAAGDPAAVGIMEAAGREIARSLTTAFGTASESDAPPLPRIASWSGGLFAAQGSFTRAFEDEFARLAPDAELRPPVGSPLDGAVTLARLVSTAATRPASRPPYLWV
jgi:N-acetylglucosamine kinase-like BadF-type ATPase